MPQEPSLTHEQLARVFSSITEYAIFTTDAIGSVCMWNEGADRVFGYAAPQIVGQPFAALFVPEDQARGAHLQEMHDASPTGRAADERYHVRRDGSRFFASGILFPLRAADGSITGFVKVCRDLTVSTQQEHALQAMHEMLEQRVVQRTAQLSQELAERRAAEQRTRRTLERMITLQEDERRRIARELHDHLGQQITALHLQFELLKKDAHGDPQPVEGAHQMFRTLDRDLDFFTWELRPGVLYNLGLVAALTDFTAAFAQNYRLPVTFDCVGVDEADLSRTAEINLYRIAQEAVNKLTSTPARRGLKSCSRNATDESCSSSPTTGGASPTSGKRPADRSRDGTARDAGTCVAPRRHLRYRDTAERRYFSVRLDTAGSSGQQRATRAERTGRVTHHAPARAESPLTLPRR